MTQKSEGRYGSFIVTDEPDNYVNRDREWPWIVEFKVSMRNDEAAQLRRAREYAEYLNKGIVIQPPIGTTDEIVKEDTPYNDCI